MIIVYSLFEIGTMLKTDMEGLALLKFMKIVGIAVDCMWLLADSAIDQVITILLTKKNSKTRPVYIDCLSLKSLIMFFINRFQKYNFYVFLNIIDNIISKSLYILSVVTLLLFKVLTIKAKTRFLFPKNCFWITNRNWGNQINMYVYVYNRIYNTTALRASLGRIH